MFYERYLLLCSKRGGIKPSSAATAAGFNKGTVSVWKKKYEHGIDVTPDQDTIDKICTYFGCSERWLRGLEEKEKPTPVTEDGPSDPLDARLNELLAQATEETKQAMIVLLEQSQKP